MNTENTFSVPSNQIDSADLNANIKTGNEKNNEGDRKSNSGSDRNKEN